MKPESASAQPSVLRIVTGAVAASGLQNMQTDEDFLNHAVRTGESTLRFYQWSEPTISLGYFQKDPAAVPEALRGLELVRRLSGGGAILHDRELTYSLALASSHPWARDPTRIYQRVHEPLIDLLQSFDLDCRLRGSAQSDPGNKSFLCFARADPNDIVVGSHKIVGSAQRRRKGAVLQHGSILLDHSAYAPEFPGIRDMDCTVSMGAIQECLVSRLGQGFDSRRRFDKGRPSA